MTHSQKLELDTAAAMWRIEVQVLGFKPLTIWDTRRSA